jgi:hypothetical protein
MRMWLQLKPDIPRKDAIDRLAFGIFLLVGGTVWLLQKTGQVKNAETFWPFALVYWGTLIAASGIYRLKL